MSDYSFSKWPEDTFSSVHSKTNVRVERVYHDSEEFVVSVHAGEEKLASFDIVFENPKTHKHGLVTQNSILIVQGKHVSAYNFKGVETAEGFCCAESLNTVPGNSELLISTGKKLKVWRLSDLGLL